MFNVMTNKVNQFIINLCINCTKIYLCVFYIEQWVMMTELITCK